MTDPQPHPAIDDLDPTPGYVRSALADGRPADYHARAWQPGPGLTRDLPDPAYASTFLHDEYLTALAGDHADPPAPSASWTWVPTQAEQQIIDRAADHPWGQPGPAPLQALHAGQEALAEQRHASLEAASQGDLINGSAVFDLDPTDHTPLADAARAELTALDHDLAADTAVGAVGLDDGPDLADDFGL